MENKINGYAIMKKLLFIFVVMIAQFGYAQIESIDYLGQTPPGDSAIVFAPGILSTSAREHHGPAVSPDGKEIFWSVQTVTDDTVYKSKLMFSRFIDNNWTEPAEATFSHGEHGQPAFSPDGNNLYLLRDDSLPSSEVKLHIVCYTKQSDEWANPVTICEGAFPSIANNGTIYYCGLSGNRITGIFKRTKKDGIYNEPEKLPAQINNPNTMSWTPYIAPDESYIIFSRLNRNGDRGELMISFRNSDTGIWAEPINIGSPVNTWSQERQPRVSPDGKYLFFSRWISDNNEVIFWVSSRIIERLKP